MYSGFDSKLRSRSRRISRLFISSKKNKRICIVLTAIKYFTEFYDINIPLIFDYNLIIQACGNINYMYNLKKQNEQNTKEQINNKIDEFGPKGGPAAQEIKKYVKISNLPQLIIFFIKLK